MPSADGEASVPRFPLGLPMVMAVFTMFGSTGPVLRAARHGVRVDRARISPRARAHFRCRIPHHAARTLLAAALLAVDPLFAAYAIQPMSDVPATCWLLAAVWLCTGGSGQRRGLTRPARGVCAGMAMLTRPALLPAVVVLLVLRGRRREMHADRSLLRRRCGVRRAPARAQLFTVRQE